MPVSVSYGRILELGYGPQRCEKVLHFTVQSCESFPRSDLVGETGKESVQGIFFTEVQVKNYKKKEGLLLFAHDKPF